MAKIRSVWLLVISLLIIGIDVSAQNDVLVNTQVIPPYSPYISSYVDQPNKLIITLQNLTQQTKNIKLWVRIAGDNNVSVTTMPNFKPSAPIVLGPNQFKQIDFSSNETRGYFDAQNINLVGITKAQLIQNQALPEGSYTFCVKALDYNAGAPLSMDQPSGCTAPFPIYYIDPPQALTPACSGEVQPNTPQSILFSWSPPATAPGNIQYQFTLKEVPNSLNPNDVIKNAAFPVLYSTTVTSITTLLYSVALPQLAKGKKYVWRVRAIDPFNGVQFKNQGYSEACWFTYKQDDVPGFNPNVNVAGINAGTAPVNTGTGGGYQYTPVVTVNQGTVYLPPFITFTTIQGKLVYKYNTYATKYPMQKAIIRLLYGYQFKQNNTSNIHCEDLCIDGICSGQELDIASTDDDGNFTFTAMPNKPFGLIKENYTVGSGEFKSTGSVYRVCYIVIENPYKEFYNDPTTSYSPEIGATVNAGEVVSIVKSCKLQVTVKRTGSETNALENATMTLANANVYLCRKPLLSTQKRLFPKEDGNPEEAFTAPGALNGLEVVGKYHTDGNGTVTFDKIIRHNNPNYRYYVYADFEKNQTGYYNYVALNGVEQLTYNPDNGSGGVVFDLMSIDQTYYQSL
jgi:TANFOR domain-containing protein